MAITSEEILLYYPATVSDALGNGGRMSHLPVGEGDIFPSAQNSERVAGSTKYRKVFYKIENADDLAMSNTRFFIMSNTPGNDMVTCFAGTQRDTQSELAPARVYGSGLTLNTQAVGSTTITLVQESTVSLFSPGDMALITNKSTVESEQGYMEQFTVNGVSQTGTTVALTMANSYSLQFEYSAGAKVSSIIDLGTIATSVGSVSNTSVAGTFDSVELLTNNIGTVEEDWTVTFSSSSAFSVMGGVVGSVGTGTISTTFTADNPNFTDPYFETPAACWGGTFANNDVVRFTTHPAAKSVWFKRTIPLNCQALANNSLYFAILGDSDE